MSAFAAFVHLLACPDCKAGLEFGPVDDGLAWLHCANCKTSTPVVGEIALFTETRTGAGTVDELRQIAQEIAGSEADYVAYMDEKLRRQVVDAYCAFDPFNESSQCARHFLEAAEASLTPGSAILDLGLRSGWSGAWLAGRFAEQQVISVCWTGSGALGYRGAQFWFGATRRSRNQVLLFSAITRPLPLRDGAFALVHAHDCLHRSPDNSLLSAALAAGARDATLVFAHIHLSDSEPEPWFERGGVLRPGAEYRQILEQATAADGREVCLVAEAALFKAITRADAIPCDLDSAPGYNGIAMVAPQQVLELARSSHARVDPSPDARVLINPMLLVNPFTGSVTVDASALGGRTFEMLERHPPFAEALRRSLPAKLQPDEVQLLRSAESGANISGIAAAMDSTDAGIIAVLHRLSQAQVAFPAPLSLHHFHLSCFHASQRSVFDGELPRVLEQWAEESPHGPGGFLFAHEVDRSEALRIVQAVARYFLKIGLQPGEAVAFHARGADALWPLLACLCLGAVPTALAATARIAVLDSALGQAQHELYPDRLAEVLDAYIDVDAVGSEHLRIAFGLSTRGWERWITTDANGRLCRSAAMTR